MLDEPSTATLNTAGWSARATPLDAHVNDNGVCNDDLSELYY